MCYESEKRAGQESGQERGHESASHLQVTVGDLLGVHVRKSVGQGGDHLSCLQLRVVRLNKP